MKRIKRIAVVMMVASILVINALPVSAAEASSMSTKGGEVLQNQKVDSGMISKSEFLEEVKRIKAEFPEASIDLKIASEEFDVAIKNRNPKNLAAIKSEIVKGPKEVYTKVKDDGTILSLKVYAASSWETTAVTPGSRSGNYYTGTKCEVRHINNCTTLGVSFRVDHTTNGARSYVDRTYGLGVIGFPDFAMGIGVSIYRESGSFAKIYVTGHDLNAGIQYFHGYIVFHPEDLTLYTSYVWD